MNIQKKTKISVSFSEEDWKKFEDLQDLLNKLERTLCGDTFEFSIDSTNIIYTDFREDETAQIVVKDYLANIRAYLNELDAWVK